MKLVQTILGGGGGSARLLALAALLGLLAAAALSLAPAAAEGELDQFELVLSLEEDSDNVVPAGSELTVNAALRFPWQLPITPPADQPSYVPYKLDVPGAGSALSRLRISGNLEWDSAGRQRLELAAQTLIQSDHEGPGSQWAIKAFDGRTIVARENGRSVYILDSYTLAHVATLTPPAGTGGNHNSGFGGSDARQTGGRGTWIGKAIDVWHETADRAWLFIGSWADTADMESEAGRLHRYRLDWDGDSVTVTPMGSLYPPRTESRNRHGQTWAWYGAAVGFSRDGSTLAVTAPRMNMMGAVYVYSRPDGPGEDWGDVEYADGVKVSVGEVPALGVQFNQMPFNPNSASGCDAWCSMVWSSAARESNHIAGLGSQRVSLSADGQVLVVGNGVKPYSLTTPGGSFNNANRRDNAGEAYVWVAPEGGWQNAPLADRDADGNRRTLFAAKTNATSFRRATHYSPGPLRRWTEPAAVLAPAAWPNVGGDQFGREAVVSADGSTVAVGNSSNAVYIFQRDSAGDWASAAGGYLTPDATLSGLWPPDEGPMHFSPDGSELAVSQIPGNAVRVFSRPADGTWVSATGSTARLVRVPAGFASRFGSVIPELSGQRVALGAQAWNTDWLTYPILSAASGCTTSTVDGETTASCPLTLPGSTITIPEGTPDGPFTISGSVALQLGSGDPVTVRGSLEVTVGDVDELAKVEFDFATDPSTGQPYPAVVSPGGSTTLLLKLLNENGKASAKGAAASVLFTASRGALSARLGAAAGEACSASGGASCRLPNPATELTADNSDQIRLTVTHPGANKAGAARIRAVVVNSAGRNFAIEPIVVTFSGTPTALAIAKPATALLGYAPAGSVDQRNKATLVVSASDARGNKAAAPTSRYSAKLTDSDGKAVTSQQVELTWPLREGDAADGALVLRDGSPQARVTILASAAAPLAVGEYTLELSAGSGGGKLTAEQTIVVAGGAAEVTLSAEPAGEIEPGASVTVTAVVTDASGALVPDGTLVRFTELSAGENVVLVLRSSAGQLTRNGEASVTLQALNSGGAYVTADADEVSGAQVINVAAPPPPPLSEYVTSTAANAFSIWTGPQLVSAAQLLAALEGVSSIRKQIDGVWVSYGETNGLLNRGSVNFAIGPGDILWLGG